KAIVSLEGVLSVLKHVDLLVTGDTSVKHLANAFDTPVLELSLGSSDYGRTGIYRANNLILQPLLGCSPCPHSKPCSELSHLCATGLTPEVVSMTAHHLMARDWPGLRELAREFESEIRFLRTRLSTSGFWAAVDLSATDPSKTVT